MEVMFRLEDAGLQLRCLIHLGALFAGEVRDELQPFLAYLRRQRHNLPSYLTLGLPFLMRGYDCTAPEASREFVDRAIDGNCLGFLAEFRNSRLIPGGDHFWIYAETFQSVVDAGVTHVGFGY